MDSLQCCFLDLLAKKASLQGAHCIILKLFIIIVVELRVQHLKENIHSCNEIMLFRIRAGRAERASVGDRQLSPHHSHYISIQIFSEFT